MAGWDPTLADLLLSVVTVAVLGYVGTNLVVNLRRVLRSGGRRETVALLRGLRPRHLLAPLPVLAVVLLTATLLYLVPPLRFGWWTAIGGRGNIIFGSTSQTDGTVLEVLIPVAFVALLIPALPLLVQAEERRFRFGAEEWSQRRRAARALQFGLVHALVGIPIAVALALSVTGLWLTWVYVRRFRATGDRRQAMAESTRAHLGYDLVVVLLVAAALALGGCAGGGTTAGGLRVTSPAMRAGGRLPERFSCEGLDLSPPLAWTGVPAAATSLAVVVTDPDAPGGVFTHWVLVGLDPARRSLAESERPAGAVEGLASSGAAAYVGPCPPDGRTHRYRFSIDALSEPVTVSATTSPEAARSAIAAATVATGTLEVHFGR